MADVAETIKLYYDFKSPFTYLAMEPAYKLEETHRVRLRFIPLELAIREAYGGDLEQRAQRDWDKVRYLYMDMRRFANERGMIIRGPQKIFDSRLALMSGIYADRHGRFRPYADRVFERFFKRELNIEDFDALAAVMTEVGLDAAGFRATPTATVRRSRAAAPKPSATACSACLRSTSRANCSGATIASSG